MLQFMLTLNVDNESGANIVPAKHQHVNIVSHDESCVVVIRHFEEDGNVPVHT